MSTTGWTNLFLPSKMAYHLKIIIGGFFITMFFNMVWKGTPFAEGFWIMVGIMIVQLEVFMAIASRMFQVEGLKASKNYKGTIITRLLTFFLLVLVIAFAFSFLIILLGSYSNEDSFSLTVQSFISKESKNFFISWLIAVGLASLFFFYMEWAQSLKREQKLREEKLLFQYETLKSQVNPHFLFNSLNTLASLVAKDGELAEQFITKFSSIYRYILENREKDWVSLADEISFVENYFFLQRIRDDGKVHFLIEIANADEYQVLPISLQLLIENALKHNAATKESPLKIKVTLEESCDRVIVENNKQKKLVPEHSSKAGLKNLEERVSLMMGKQLIVEESPQKFVVRLPIIKTGHEDTDHRR